MDFATFMSQFGGLSCDNAYLLLYAIATCLLTQAVKKLFIDRAKVEILHKFDPTPLLPFIFGTVFAVIDVYVVQGARGFGFSDLMHIALTAIAIGALASTGFRFVNSVSGQSLSSLMKNDVFGVFYTQLLYIGGIRERIKDNKLTMQEFINTVKQLTASAEDICKQDCNAETKRKLLAELLDGLVDESGIDACVSAIFDALTALFADR